MKRKSIASKRWRLNFWEPLRPGDLIDIVAPAWPCSRSELNRGVAFLRKVGFRIRVPKNIFAKGSMFANSDQERCDQLVRALSAHDSSAVWCVRGGYGALRLLPDLKRVPRPNRVKPLIGFSDISSLHTFLSQEWGWPTLHATLVDRLGRREAEPGELLALFEVLTGERSGVEYDGLKLVRGSSLRGHKSLIRAPLRGGNLAVVASSIGTPFELKARDSILFFEDIGERPHRVDRMLVQMRQSGFLEGVRAIVWGPLILANERDERELWQRTLPRLASELDLPMLSGLPCGHGPLQYPLPLGSMAELDLERGRISVASGARSLAR